MCKVWIVNMRRIMAVPTRQCWRIARIHSSRFFDMNSIKCVINVVNISWVARIYWKPYKKGKTIKTMNNMHNKSNQHHHKSYINEADKCVPNELTAVYVQLKRNTEIQNVHASPATVWHFFFLDTFSSPAQTSRWSEAPDKNEHKWKRSNATHSSPNSYTFLTINHSVTNCIARSASRALWRHRIRWHTGDVQNVRRHCHPIES